VPDGVYVLRLAARRESGGVSVRRLPVRRSGGRFRALGAFSYESSCGALASASLGRPAFGRALKVTDRLRSAATVRVVVRRGGKVVRKLALREGVGRHANRIRGLPRGSYGVTVAAGSRRATLAALRL
jgi:hypothetical protein